MDGSPTIEDKQINLVEQLDHTFADEWQLPDLVLMPSEVRAARQAAEAIGMQLRYTPTGRTVQMILLAALDLAVYNEARATNRYAKAAWHSVAIKARNAIAAKPFN